MLAEVRVEKRSHEEQKHEREGGGITATLVRSKPEEVNGEEWHHDGERAQADETEERAEEARKLITWGMRGFELLPVYAEGKVVTYANVFGGTKPAVGLVGKGKIDLFVPKGATNCPTATVTYRGPLRPPVEKDQAIGKLHVFCDGKEVQTTPLYAEETIEQIEKWPILRTLLLWLLFAGALAAIFKFTR